MPPDNRDSVSVRLDTAEERTLIRKWYESYLGKYFMPPLADPIRRTQIQKLFEAPRGKAFSLRVESSDTAKRVVQEYILSFKEKVSWGDFTTQELVEKAFGKEQRVLSLSNEFDVLIVIHTGKEIEHTYNVDLTAQIKGYRELHGQSMLFIAVGHSYVAEALGAQSPFDLSPVNGLGHFNP